MAENKVRFGLKNVHYAIMNSGGTYGTPVAVPGAVNLDLTPAGDTQKFYADNIAYYVTIANQGYEGTLELAKIPDTMLEEVWGYSLGSTSKVLTEDASAEPKTFALLFQVDGDQGNEYYVMYSCNAARPAVGSQTVEETKEPRTQTVDLTVSARTDGKVYAKTTATTPDGVKSAWFTAVYVEGAVTT